MTPRARSGLSHVDRFWSQVDQKPRREHLYVALLGLRTYETTSLLFRLEGRPAVLRVPSVLIPAESNFLLNAAHPDFSTIEGVLGPTPSSSILA